MARPTPSDATESERCCPSRSWMALLPVQLAGSVYQARTCPRKSIGSAPARFRPRGEAALDRQEAKVDDRGEEDDDGDAGDGGRREPLLDADVHDQVAESAHPDQGRD